MLCRIPNIYSWPFLLPGHTVGSHQLVTNWNPQIMRNPPEIVMGGLVFFFWGGERVEGGRECVVHVSVFTFIKMLGYLTYIKLGPAHTV